MRIIAQVLDPGSVNGATVLTAVFVVAYVTLIIFGLTLMVRMVRAFERIAKAQERIAERPPH